MKVAIYCRLSEEDRNKQCETDDSNSIQNQKAMLLQYADKQGWSVYDIYSDDDYTGSDRRRPAFNRLLKDAEQHKFDIILCKSQSRFTREMELVEKYIHGLFPIWGIRFVSIVDNADTANKGNKKSRQINGLVNEWYLEDMSESIRSVLNNRRLNGLHIGAFALYGYKKDPDRKGHLLVDEEAAAVVREVFSLFAQGYGKTAIARELNARGIPNPTEYKRLHGLGYQQPYHSNSTLWKYSTISSMLTNEIYIGNMVQGRYGSVSYKTKENRPRPESEWYVVEGTHEAIIDRDLWDRVQSLSKQRAKACKGGTIGLFAKKACCLYCGQVLRSSKARGHHYLRCPNRYVAKDACVGAYIPVSELEQIVLTELHQLSFDDTDLLRSTLEEQKASLLSGIAEHRKKVEEYSKGVRELYLDKVNGIISADDYVELARGFTEERGRLELLIRDAEEQIEKLDARWSAGVNRRELLTRYAGVEHLTRAAVVDLIDHVTVGKRDRATGKSPIKIYWNF